MAVEDFVPVLKEHNTAVWKGYGTDNPNVEGGKIDDLGVTEYEGSLNSVWKLKSMWQRVKFLFRGEVTLRIMSQLQPPVAVVVGDVFEKK